jgi:hypothetical protein
MSGGGGGGVPLASLNAGGARAASSPGCAGLSVEPALVAKATEKELSAQMTSQLPLACFVIGGAAAASSLGCAGLSSEPAVVTKASEHELLDPLLVMASESSDDFAPRRPRAPSASLPSREHGAAGAPPHKRRRHAAPQPAKKSAKLDDSDDEAESPSKPRSMWAQHTASMDEFTRTLEMYEVEGLVGRFLFIKGCFVNVATDILFENYRLEYPVSAYDEPALRSKLKKLTGQARVWVIEHADFEQRRSSARRMLMFTGGKRLVFTDGGQATLLSSTNVNDTFIFKTEVVALSTCDTCRLGRFVDALKGSKEQALQVIDTRPLRHLITQVAGRYANMFLTLLGRAFAGCSDADKWMVVAYSMTRNVGKTLLLQLLGRVLGSKNPLRAFVTNTERDALAYCTGGDQAKTRVERRVEAARLILVDELANDKPVETASTASKDAAEYLPLR